jgi:energy-coupling factor transport system substrate-specific component
MDTRTGQETADREFKKDRTGTPDRRPPRGGTAGNPVLHEHGFLRKFTVRDIVFLAILAAALTLTGMVTMPLVMTVTLFGVRNAAAAIFYGAFGVIALMKVPKPGALVLLGLFNGAILLMMSPVMFFNNAVGSLLAEGVALLVFRGYGTDRSVVVAAGLFVPFTLPLSILFGMLVNGSGLSDLVERPMLSALFCAAAVGLSFAGALVGRKIGGELRKAGRI